MKNSAASLKKLNVLLKKISSPAREAPSKGDPLATLVMSFLMWESTTEKAVAAYKRIMERVVDFNDLRVCMPHETVDLIGARYPRALDRCQRLRAVLRNVYLREHSVTLSRLASSSKRDAKRYIETLEGMVPYVSARMLLLEYDTHCIPVDDQLRTQLIEAEIVDASVEVPELAVWLTNHIKQSDGVQAHLAFQSWVEAGSSKRAGSSSGKRASRSTSGPAVTRKRPAKRSKAAASSRG